MLNCNNTEIPGPKNSNPICGTIPYRNFNLFITLRKRFHAALIAT